MNYLFPYAMLELSENFKPFLRESPKISLSRSSLVSREFGVRMAEPPILLNLAYCTFFSRHLRIPHQSKHQMVSKGLLLSVKGFRSRPESPESSSTWLLGSSRVFSGRNLFHIFLFMQMRFSLTPKHQNPLIYENTTYLIFEIRFDNIA